MSNLGYNIIVLVVAWLLIAAGGFYWTFMEQPKELERLEKAEKVAKLRHAEVTSLLAEESASAQLAQEVVDKWRARYKIVPGDLTTPNIVAYLNALTATGFKNFDVSLVGNKPGRDFNTYTFRVNGRGYYTSLYKFIWEIENNRNFYAIRDLALENIDLITEDKKTGRDKLQVMVSFRLNVDAFYGGADGLSAPEGGFAANFESDVIPTGQTGRDRPPVPSYVLPEMRPISNPFYPLILDELPPNTYGHLDLGQAELASIIGDQAVFVENGEYVTVQVGDPIYLGEIILIDPTADRVVAKLNRGGIIDEVELSLHGENRYRQAMGSVRLAPVESED